MSLVLAGFPTSSLCGTQQKLIGYSLCIMLFDGTPHIGFFSLACWFINKVTSSGLEFQYAYCLFLLFFLPRA